MESYMVPSTSLGTLDKQEIATERVVNDVSNLNEQAIHHVSNVSMSQPDNYYPNREYSDERLEKASKLIFQALLVLDVESKTRTVKTNGSSLGNDTNIDSAGLVESIQSSLMNACDNGLPLNIEDENVNTCIGYRHGQPEYDEGMRCFPHLLSISSLTNLYPTLPSKLNSTFSTISLRSLMMPSITKMYTHRQLHSMLLYNLSQIKLLSDQPDSAIASFIDTYHTNRDGSLVVPILHNIGYIHYRSGKLSLSYQLYHTALLVLEQKFYYSSVSTQALISVTMNCLGVICLHTSTTCLNRPMEYLSRSLLLHQRDLYTHNDTPIATSCNVMLSKGMASRTLLMASTVNNIARVHFMNQNFLFAKRYSYESLALRQSQLGNDHLDVAAAMFNLGQAHYELKEYDQALSFCQEFLRITKPKFGAGHKDVAFVLKCIALIYKQQEDYSRAIPAFREALTASMAAHGVHIEVAFLYNQLGNLFCSIKDYDSALSMYEEGLNIEEILLPRTDVKVAITISNIAHVHRLLGDLIESLQLYEKVYRLQAAPDSSCTPIAIVALSNIASIQYLCNDFTKSYESYEELLRIRRDRFGDCSLDVASTLNSMGLVLYKMRFVVAAAQSFMNSLQILRMHFGTCHSNIAVNLCNIAIVLLEAKDEDSPMMYFKEALFVERNVFGIHHPKTIPTLQNIAKLYESSGHYNEAILHYQSVLFIQRQDIESPTATSQQDGQTNQSMLVTSRNDNSHPYDSGNNDINNGATTRAFMDSIDDMIQTLCSISTLYLQIGNGGAYVDLMAETWRLLCHVRFDPQLNGSGGSSSSSNNSSSTSSIIIADRLSDHLALTNVEVVDAADGAAGEITTATGATTAMTRSTRSRSLSKLKPMDLYCIAKLHPVAAPKA